MEQPKQDSPAEKLKVLTPEEVEKQMGSGPASPDFKPISQMTEEEKQQIEPAQPSEFGNPAQSINKPNKKTSLGIVVFAIIAIGVGLLLSRPYLKGISLSSNSSRAGNGNNPGSSCPASSAVDFKKCLHRISSGTADSIEVKSYIDCYSREDCAFVFDNINRPVTIFGADAAKGFKRSRNFNYRLFSITNSSQISIRDLKFEDDSSVYCKPLDDTNCLPLISLIDDGKVTIDRISILNGKSRALVAAFNTRVPDITISNSSFIGVEAHAILTTAQITGGKFNIIGNKFQNTGSNAFALWIASPPGDPSIVRGNEFIHNHYKTIYNICGGTGTGRCPGGQTYIYSRTPGPATSNIVVRGNLFKDGYIETPIPGDIYGVNGLEVDNSGVKGVVVQNNGFINNDSGITVNLEPCCRSLGLSSGLVFRDNIFNALHFPLPNLNILVPVQYVASNNVAGTEADATNIYLANRDNIVSPTVTISITPTPIPTPTPTVTTTPASNLSISASRTSGKVPFSTQLSTNAGGAISWYDNGVLFSNANPTTLKISKTGQHIITVFSGNQSAQVIVVGK